MQHRTLTLTSPAFAGMTEQSAPYLHALRSVLIEQPGDNAFGQAGFNRLCFQKVAEIIATLGEMPEGEWLLYTDADVVWFRSSADVIEEAERTLAAQSPELPMVAQHDPDSGPCAGFIAMRNTAAVRGLWSLVFSYRSSAYNDQNVLCHFARGKVGLFSADFIASWGNQVGGLWTPERAEPVRVPEGCAAWHLNYVVGVENKRRLAERLMRA
jgi:hypothetical protein